MAGNPRTFPCHDVNTSLAKNRLDPFPHNDPPTFPTCTVQILHFHDKALFYVFPHCSILLVFSHTLFSDGSAMSDRSVYLCYLTCLKLLVEFPEPRRSNWLVTRRIRRKLKKGYTSRTTFLLSF